MGELGVASLVVYGGYCGPPLQPAGGTTTVTHRTNSLCYDVVLLFVCLFVVVVVVVVVFFGRTGQRAFAKLPRGQNVRTTLSCKPLNKKGRSLQLSSSQ